MTEPTPTAPANTEATADRQMASEPEPAQALETPPETGTAQSAGNEPITSQPEPIALEPKAPVEPTTVVVTQPRSLIHELFAKAQRAIQFRKRKKLDHILTLFAKRTNITNNEVGDLLHVSDATATRYLQILEKENKIKQVGKTGHAVSYIKI